MDIQNYNPAGKYKNRLELLKLLCILTFIGSGLAAFSNLFILLSFDVVSELMDETTINIPEIAMILSGGKSFFLAGFVLYVVSLAGAIQMWNLHKIGFHLYTASQLFILILPAVMIDPKMFSVVSLFLTSAFIFGYFSQIKLMT
ncbi:MAG: hypothetical protein K9G76_01920 [Bacteroidales bacterium]|nr:hypothetical protein [Bacteroidales bacterium]MCF8403311.1 hypothetical protein [Bacteroidales bacterium]